MISKETTISAEEVGEHFEDMVRRVRDGEVIVVEQGDQPQVAIIPVEEYRRMTGSEPDIPEWQSKLDEASEMLSRDLAGKKIDWDQIIYDMREERSQQLLENLGYGGSTDESDSEHDQ
jgi:prevent-host-death family protein